MSFLDLKKIINKAKIKNGILFFLRCHVLCLLDIKGESLETKEIGSEKPQGPS